jgi:hypothetical protein
MSKEIQEFLNMVGREVTEEEMEGIERLFAGGGKISESEILAAAEND